LVETNIPDYGVNMIAILDRRIKGLQNQRRDAFTSAISVRSSIPCKASTFLIERSLS
jgi:hypothetical protein